MRKKTKNNQKKSKVIDLTNDLEPISVGYRNKLKARTQNQQSYIDTVSNNTITFCQGVAGSGKTHIAIGIALEYLLDNRVKKIIITRPVVESGEKIGYLPGTAEEKLHPYLLPILDEINYFIPMSQYAALKLNNKVEIVPLGLMRGRSFHNSFIVADECQNATYDQLKMLLTRIGMDSKMVLTGDIGQSDLSYNHRGGFPTMIKSLNNIHGIGLSNLNNSDIIRNPIIGSILEALDNHERNQA